MKPRAPDTTTGLEGLPVPEKDLIERARTIHEGWKAEAGESKRLGLTMEDYEQQGKYIYYFKNGSPIAPKKVFSSPIISEVPEINLYVHIPFCTGRCTFCCCYSVGRRPESTVDAYVHSLKKELDLLVATSRFDHSAVRYIYFGGGTPTCLSAGQLDDLIGSLRRRLNVLPEANFTCEASPETIVGSAGKEKLEALVKNGTTRLSIGVQSFDDGILMRIGRSHGSETAMAAYENASAAGFRNLNVDLMFGLPGQTLDTWERDLQIVTALRPGWVSLYRLRTEENPRIYEAYTRARGLFPDKETTLLMNIMAVEKAADSGYTPANAPHTFVLQSRLDYVSRHVLAEEELGIGASARSYLDGVRYYNIHDLKKYRLAIDKGRLPISFAGKYSKRQQVERAAVLMLRSSKGVARADFRTAFGIDFEKLFGEPLRKLNGAGMITDDGETFQLSHKGVVFAAEAFRQLYSIDPVDRLRDAVFNNRFLKRLFLRTRFSKPVEAMATVVKTWVGSSE
jgi:oxygen-independent coproporphyrinogen-3 oxidase